MCAVLLLTTRRGVWFIFLVDSVCMSVRLSDNNFQKALTYKVHICTAGVSPGSTSQAPI